MKTVPRDFIPEMPDRFRCPICGEKLAFEAITGMKQGDDGWYVDSFDFGCVTEPDMDSREWKPWFYGHHHEPYTDWLPMHVEIEAWLRANYRFEVEK